MAQRASEGDGERLVQADAVLLALGGASWPRLGSDAAWTTLLAERGVTLTPLQPANCGFDCAWSEHFRQRFGGKPVTSVAITWTDANGRTQRRQGQFVVTGGGVEGSLIYALSATLREQINATGAAVIHLDLAPDWSAQRVLDEVTRPRGSRSLSSHLQSRLKIKGVQAGLLRECLSEAAFAEPEQLAAGIKALPLRLVAARPIAEAISSAGGVQFEALDAGLMLKAAPGVFCAGEMLDWEAPTGGYLLTGCFASGRAAALGVLAWLQNQA